MRWDYVDLLAGQIHLPDSKTGRKTIFLIHDLRHTYASLALAQNLSLPIVGKLLGHKSSKSTERYAHLYTDVMANAANKVGE